MKFLLTKRMDSYPALTPLNFFVEQPLLPSLPNRLLQRLLSSIPTAASQPTKSSLLVQSEWNEILAYKANGMKFLQRGNPSPIAAYPLEMFKG